MRIVVDMQGAQSIGSRDRGIGRYTLPLVQAIIRNRGEHEIILALNGLFPETIESLRNTFNELLPPENIRVWYAREPIALNNRDNNNRRKIAEIVYEAFLADLNPDLILVSSFIFEGWVDNALTEIEGVAHIAPIAVILYDLIPTLYPAHSLKTPEIKAWYNEQATELREADLLLAISEATRLDGVAHLGFDEEGIVNISGDADQSFRQLDLSEEQKATLRDTYGVNKPFVLNVGGVDARKNAENLLRAFALLPANIRQEHQLVLVCALHPEGRYQLERMIKKLGLTEQVILTDYVSDDELKALYNACSLFVLPSWYEGFGLPALEAMRCGAPTIGSNTSSIPEVIGLDEALFDPHSVESISMSIQRALTDEDFRAELIGHAQEQSLKFSWDESACTALRAMEHTRDAWRAPQEQLKHKPTLAYISPLPPEHTGIAGYSAQLLPELAKHYRIEVIAAQDAVTDSWIGAHCPIRSPQWLLDNYASYDRVLYHFGNSSFHEHMFALLEGVPGVVVLHDFFLGNILAHMDESGYDPGIWSRALYRSHGYEALRAGNLSQSKVDAFWKYPSNLEVIQNSLGVIVHSEHSLDLARQWYSRDLEDWAVVPLVRDAPAEQCQIIARRALGLSDDDFLVCAFGHLGPIKLNDRLLDSWLQSSLAQDSTCHLVFVGEDDTSAYNQEIRNRINDASCSNRIRITGWVDDETFGHYLAAADVCVQLRTLSRGETSAAVLDCMNQGKAVIVNENGSMTDLDAQATWKLPDDFSDDQLVEALETLHADTARRASMGKAAKEIIATRHDPHTCAQQYRDAIEQFYTRVPSSISGLSTRIAREVPQLDDRETLNVASAVAQTFDPRNRKRQLFIDVSELIRGDVKTGIQRVVRSVLEKWLKNPPEGYRIEPVYATPDTPYRYARRVTAEFMGFPADILADEVIDYWSGDVFFGLDLNIGVVSAHRTTYQAMRQAGVRVMFMVYDLLCVQMPECFIPGVFEIFTQWLETVADNDAVICISQATATSFSQWVAQHRPEREGSIAVDWVHIGADLSSTVPTAGLPTDAEVILDKIRQRQSFLMVGTLEPRKAHEQVLDAFERLWGTQQPVNLVIVGKQGWLMEDFAERLRTHPEFGAHLFWLDGISDEYLEKIYDASTCLIAASFGEGFGLPLIEAAQHGLPVIARDIPVFREVAGDHAFYFKGLQAQDVADAIDTWLELHRQEQTPSSEKMPWLTWEQSAQQLMRKTLPSKAE
jgi:glycosyltransferase involved in cell wall biosynthesis